MKKEKYIIGIDPDNKESGIAIVDPKNKKVDVQKRAFPALLDGLIDCRKSLTYEVKVIIEGGWLNNSNWHVTGRYMTAQRAAEIGRRTGMNHQTGILIAEFCKHLGIEYEVVKPLKKCWKGKNGKITQEEAEYFMGKLPRMNQDERDALLLAWVYAGLKVKVKPKTAK